jgi:nicotinamidase-related amidase
MQRIAKEDPTMSVSDTALLVVDAQESFRHRPYFTDRGYGTFVRHLQALVDGATARGIPIAQILHVENTGAFSLDSGYVCTLAELTIAPHVVFHKRSHSALVGTGLDVWLVQHGIRRLIVSGIRTEQCCETTARHASDLGYAVDYVTEATLTFPMEDRHGKTWTSDEIKARTELVLDGRFARVVTVEQALAGGPVPVVA